MKLSSTQWWCLCHPQHSRAACCVTKPYMFRVISRSVQQCVLVSPAAGQANYAAANAALEAWAGAEAARGGVSLAVQWGAWAVGEWKAVHGA